jgi:hypothetical protein
VPISLSSAQKKVYKSVLEHNAPALKAMIELRAKKMKKAAKKPVKEIEVVEDIEFTDDKDRTVERGAAPEGGAAVVDKQVDSIEQTNREAKQDELGDAPPANISSDSSAVPS